MLGGLSAVKDSLTKVVSSNITEAVDESRNSNQKNSQEDKKKDSTINMSDLLETLPEMGEKKNELEAKKTVVSNSENVSNTAEVTKKAAVEFSKEKIIKPDVDTKKRKMLLICLRFWDY